MDLVERCRRALATVGESGTARAFREALAAAGDGQGDETAQALSALGERERFVATVLLGLAFPAVRRATAIAFDAAVPPGMQAFDWTWLCEQRMVGRWAAACEDVAPDVLGRLLRRAGYVSAAVAALTAIRARLAAGLIEDAIALQATIDPAAKEERAAARAAIGRKQNDDGGLLAALIRPTFRSRRTDPDTILRRVRQAARLLVRTGHHAEAIELGRLSGFPTG